MGVFERFTDRSRRVVVLAQEASRQFPHHYIGTEHLLLGLLAATEGIAAKALQSFGFEYEEVRSTVGELVGIADEPPTGHIPFTPRAKKVLELSLRASLRMGHNHVGTEHILLGLLDEGEGVAAQIIERRAPLNDVRAKIIVLLGVEGQGEGMSKRVRLKPIIGQTLDLPVVVGPSAGGWVLQADSTERARRVSSFASEEAEMREGDAVDVEDLLVALMREPETLAARTLASFGITIEELRKRIRELREKGEDEAAG